MDNQSTNYQRRETERQDEGPILHTAKLKDGRQKKDGTQDWLAATKREIRKRNWINAAAVFIPAALLTIFPPDSDGLAFAYLAGVVWGALLYVSDQQFIGTTRESYDRVLTQFERDKFQHEVDEAFRASTERVVRSADGSWKIEKKFSENSSGSTPRARA